MNAKQGEERRRLILAQARGVGHVAVTEIADELKVAAQTVRRDLKLLEGHGLMRGTHGGDPVEGESKSDVVSCRKVFVGIHTKFALIAPASLSASSVNSRIGWATPASRSRP